MTLRWLQRGRLVSLIAWGAVKITHHFTPTNARIVSELYPRRPTLLLDVEMRHMSDAGGWIGNIESSVAKIPFISRTQRTSL